MLDPRIHYTDFPWDRFKECVRATNAELWYGPLGPDYWTEVDPLEHYEWRGFPQALDDIREMLEDLPSTIYVDEDDEIIGELDPYENPNNWEDDPEREGEYLRSVGLLCCERGRGSASPRSLQPNLRRK